MNHKHSKTNNQPRATNYKLLTTKKELRKIHSFMQNKPNSQKSQMNVNNVLTKDYENVHPLRRPKTNPKQTQSNPIQSQLKPKQTQFKPKTNPIPPARFFAIYLISVIWVWPNALIAALICSGSSGQTATISARSEGSSEVSILACFGDLGVN